MTAKKSADSAAAAPTADATDVKKPRKVVRVVKAGTLTAATSTTHVQRRIFLPLPWDSAHVPRPRAAGKRRRPPP